QGQAGYYLTAHAGFKVGGAPSSNKERGNTLWELCEVEDHVGAERYFTTVMTRLKVAEGEDPLMLRWSAIAGSSQFWTEGPLSEEYLQLEGDVNKLRGELESLKTQRRRLEEEVGILWSSLDGARDDRARLEGDVLSLTEVAMLLEAKLKDEGAKAVVGYKASQGFELGLKKMGWVSYEFEYRVALKRLRGKHPEIKIKQDPFAECPEDANIRMDLSQPFDDSPPSEK
ncbi:hypothetical protein B296_00031872, partial [Ensete ventricosum]